MSDRTTHAAMARESAQHDAGLVERFNAGEDAAFDEISARYREKIFSFAFTILRNRADAEEIAQDTLIRAHRRLDRFRGDCSLSSWLHTIALNLSRNRYWYSFRRRSHLTQSLDSALSEGATATFADLAASDGPGPVREAMAREYFDVVGSCIAQLAPLHREILERRIIQDCTYDDIAEELDISLGTVKSRIARAREKLRSLLVHACPEFAPDAALFEWFDPVRPAGGLRPA